jgi:hypothetical protein
VNDCRGTGTVTPDIIYNLADGINPEIVRELSLLEETAVTIHKGAEAANKITAVGGQVTYRLAIELFIGELDEFIENATLAEN